MKIESVARIVLALLSGVLASTAFAPLSWWPMLAVSLLLLWQLWYARPGWAFFCGWLWGLAHLGTGVYWLFNSLYYFGNAHWLAAILMTLALVAFLSLYPALAGLLWTQLERRLPGYPILQVVVLATVWWGTEYLRTTVILGGFPWLSSGYTQLSGFAQDWFAVLGVVGVGWLYLLVIACIHIGIRGGWAHWPWRYSGTARAGEDARPTNKNQPKPRLPTSVKGVGSAVILALVLWWSGLNLPEWTTAQGPPIQVEVLHTDMPQNDKQNLKLSVAAVRKMIALSQNSTARVMVWPETSIPFYANRYGKTFLREIDQISQQQDSMILAGVFYRDNDTRFYNAIYTSVGGEGDYYFKQRLVPFGEFMPARSLLAFFDYWVDIPQSDLSPGPDQPPAFEGYGMRVHANICYELFFADMVHAQARDSGLLVNVSNDAWFGRAVAPAQSLEMARARSAETNRAILRASNQGISAIINERAEVIASTDGGYALLSDTISIRSGLTPIVRIGQPQVVLLILLFNILLWIYCHFRLKRTHSHPHG